MKNSYYGIDASKEISLYEYGMLVRKEGKEYSVIYGIDSENGSTYTSFGKTTYSDKEVEDVINSSWFDKAGFLSFTGLEETDWLSSDIIQKLFDLRSYYGTSNIFGDSCLSFTANQIAQKTKIAAPIFL